MKWQSIPILAALVLPGCVYSVHPLSNDSNSVVDERLLGRWEPVDEKPRLGKQREVYTVQKKQGTRATLDLVAESFSATGERKDRSEDIAFVTDRPLRLASIRLELDGEDEGYFIFRYKLPRKGMLELSMLDPSFIANAVENGALRWAVSCSC